MSGMRRYLFVVFTLWAAAAWGQSTANEPHIGLLYPAGGQQGKVILINVGGQFLRGATDVYVSGEGVQASVVQYIRPVMNLNKDQRAAIQKRLKEVGDWRRAELAGESWKKPADAKANTSRVKGESAKKIEAKTGATKKADAKDVQLPDHPLFYDLDNRSLRELAHISSIVFAPRAKQQQNRQLAESVLVEITIDPGAEPGNRELRIETPAGLTNPMVFQVGLLPEVRELEPNNRHAFETLPKMEKLPEAKPLELPVVLNGQVMPGDVDRFRFRAEEGQKLVIETHARSLIPYLADAVPGWFQATVALYDADDKEVAFADDYRFNPDPVMFYKVPESGEYELEIRDSIYRGREDFVYRVAVGEQPFITQSFPLGGKAGVKTVASISGWNVLKTRLALDTEPGNAPIRQTAYHEGDRLSNPIRYAVDELDECNEAESNDTIRRAEQVELPRIVNGRIDKPDDVDVFRLGGKAGGKIVAEVYARRLNSPLDSLLRLTDATGKIIAWNDDHVLKDSHLYKDVVGLVTHHADSYLTAELPKDGTYFVHIADSQHHGGDEYGYRLRIAVPEGDFALRTTPSSLVARAGGMVPVSVHVLRTDGFAGEIEVVLKDAPDGFKLNGGRIPSGCDRIRMTLAVPGEAPDKPVALQLEGRARIGGKTVAHRAVPSEDMMQAFLYRHLVPSQELLVSVSKNKGRVPLVELAQDGPVMIPSGGTAQVRLNTLNRRSLGQMRLELKDPPEGLTMQNVKVVNGGLEFALKVDKDSMADGFEDNLIIEAFTQYTSNQKNAKGQNQKRSASIGVLPAVPIKIVQ